MVLFLYFFSWLLPLFVKGNKKQLTEDDMYQNRKSHDSGLLANLLEVAWSKEKRRSKNPSLLKVITRTFGVECLGLYVMAIIAEVVV